MAKIITFCNQKGGVGKTTTVINLGAALAERGRKILVVDLDPQGNATSGLGIDKNTVDRGTYDLLGGDATLSEVSRETKVKNLWVVPSNRNLAGAEVELIKEFRREYYLQEALGEATPFDFVLIDCPPSLGILTVNALTAAHEILIPLQCEYYALEGLSELLRTWQLVRAKLNPRLEILGLVLTMADSRTRLTAQVSDEVRKFLGKKVFAAVIPRSVRASEAPSFGEAVIFFDPHSRVAKAYRELGAEFLARDGKQAGAETVSSEAKETVAVQEKEEGVNS